VPEPVASEERFEVVSRGDPVPVRLWLGTDPAPRASAVLVHALGSGKDAREVEALARRLAAAGLAAAAIDLPLHGDRASRKLSARLAACGAAPRTASDRLLFEEFLRQAALDLAAVRRALARRASLGAGPVACVAHASAGAVLEAWRRHEPEVTPLVCDAFEPPAAVADALREALARG
jgi:alpha-beta hydrolase superfamily lysophospholipase